MSAHCSPSRATYLLAPSPLCIDSTSTASLSLSLALLLLLLLMSVSDKQDIYAGKLFLWVDTFCIFAHWPDDAAGLADAKACMLQQWRLQTTWHGVSLSDIQHQVKAMRSQFYIRRTNRAGSGPDEVVCTLQQAEEEEESH